MASEVAPTSHIQPSIPSDTTADISMSLSPCLPLLVQSFTISLLEPYIPYTWTQDYENVYVTIPFDRQIYYKDLEVEIKTYYLKVRFVDSEESLLEVLHFHVLHIHHLTYFRVNCLIQSMQMKAIGW